MSARWAATEDNKFVARLKITAIDKAGLLNQVIALLAQQGISITLVEAHAKSKGNATINLGIQVKSTEELDFIIKKIQNIEDILSVSRSN